MLVACVEARRQARRGDADLAAGGRRVGLVERSSPSTRSNLPRTWSPSCASPRRRRRCAPGRSSRGRVVHRACPFVDRAARPGPSRICLLTQLYSTHSCIVNHMGIGYHPAHERDHPPRHRVRSPPSADPARLAARVLARLPDRARARQPRLDDDLRTEHELTLAEYVALLQLAESPDRRLRINQLADRVVLSRSGVTRLIDRLEADGLVEPRSHCSSDGRGAEAVLTDGVSSPPAGESAPISAGSSRTSSTPSSRSISRPSSARALRSASAPDGRTTRGAIAPSRRRGARAGLRPGPAHRLDHDLGLESDHLGRVGRPAPRTSALALAAAAPSRSAASNATTVDRGRATPARNASPLPTG